ncbi:MAG: hypothetical protein ABSF98_07575 [Bryobacteraceae bacterium]|jgi:plasmid stability protein
MTITVDITPEVKAALARQAAAHGRAVEAYAASLIEEAVQPTTEALTAGEREGRKSVVEGCAMARGLTDDVDFSRNPSTGRPVDLS